MSKKITFAIPTSEVVIPADASNKAQSFRVRGVSLPDLSVVMREHGEAMAMLYARFGDEALDVSDKQTAGAISELLADVPELAATIISRCSYEALDVETTLVLPLPVQIDALMAISRLTFVGEGAVGKFIAVVTEMLRGMASAMASLNLAPNDPPTS